MKEFKVNADVLSDLASEILFSAGDNGFSQIPVDVTTVHKVELACAFKRAVAEGRKALVLVLKYD